jgi:Trk K+ transport system NAD-binding subunit
MASTYRDHVIVCGLGKVGYRTTLELLKFEREVVAIEHNPEGRFINKAKALDVPVIIANARRTEHLLQAGVERADAIIPCTDDELANLDIALEAREINPQIRVVLRLFDDDLARRVEKGFAIHTALSTSALSAPIFAAAAMRADVKHSFYVGDVLLNLSEIIVEGGGQLAGLTVHQLERRFDISVVCHQSGEMTDLHPEPEAELAPADRILVLAPLETLRTLNELNQAG